MDIERIKRKSNRSVIPSRAYFCFCGSWHLTSKVDKKDDFITKLKIQIDELKSKVNELTKMNQDGLSELDKQERFELRKDKMIKELREGLKTTQKHNKSLLKSNADLIHKNIMLQKELDLLKSEKND
jgi:hypothetical protein